ncbi:radical SAM protein [Myxococcota bacterium]|nr:radical SAM protein [Myxococcota bacterium]
MSHSSSKKLPTDPSVAVSAFAVDSRVNGPGRRVVVWVQGCTLACPGCFNPDTHAPGTAFVPVAALVRRILEARGPTTEGVTFSGGEPFQQATALAAVCAFVRRDWPAVSLFAFTGFTYEALRGPQAPPGAAGFLSHLDLLVDGRYEARAPDTRPWRGSTNQRLWVLGRRPAALTAERGRTAEIHVEPDGRVLLSGFPDAALRRAVEQLAR